MIKEILSGIAEYFTEKGCYVHHFMDDKHDPIPHIKVRHHRSKGHVECQIHDGKLYMFYQRGEHNYLKAWDAMGRPSGIIGRQPKLPESSFKVELLDPDSLPKAMKYIKKHLVMPAHRKNSLKGGLGDHVRHQRPPGPASGPEAGQTDS